MVLFTIAVTFNCLAIFSIVGNAVYDAVNFTPSRGNNVNLNLIGFAYVFWISVSFYLYGNGSAIAANIIAWVMALPVLMMGFLVLVSSIISPTPKSKTF